MLNNQEVYEYTISMTRLMSDFPFVGLCLLRVALNDIWKEHMAPKRKQIDLKTKEINWQSGKKNPIYL